MTNFGTFRGWSTGGDEWVYGSYHFEPKVWLKGHDYYIIKDDGFSYKNFIEVHPESLAMFTGIFDTEQKPIYASIPLPDGSMSKGGDILCRNNIDYNNYGAGYSQASEFCVNGWVSKPIEINLLTGLNIPSGYIQSEYQIIGNAYENPELLEENKNE